MLYFRDILKLLSALVNLGLMWTAKIGTTCNVLVKPYGCFCGVTDFENMNTLQKNNHTVDDFDKLCLEHDYCYHEIDETNLCGGWNVKYIHYTWNVDNTLKCGRRLFNYHSDCMEAVCQCDVKFVNAIEKLLESKNCPETNPGCN